MNKCISCVSFEWRCSLRWRKGSGSDLEFGFKSRCCIPTVYTHSDHAYAVTVLLLGWSGVLWQPWCPRLSDGSVSPAGCSVPCVSSAPPVPLLYELMPIMVIECFPGLPSPPASFSCPFQIITYYGDKGFSISPNVMCSYLMSFFRVNSTLPEGLGSGPVWIQILALLLLNLSFLIYKQEK